MASQNQVVNDTDSSSSCPSPSDRAVDTTEVTPQPRIRFMCSFGGKILPRPHDNHLRYVGGETRIVAINRHATFSSLLTKLSKLSGTVNVTIKYQLPNEDLDALITVAADEDVENMMEEYDRLIIASGDQKSTRLRLFLFQTDLSSISRSSSISSLLDGSVKRENWFFDALNGGPGPGPGSFLDRGRSEVSSIISEVPDYLFGLDTPDDPAKSKSRSIRNDSVSLSRPMSPGPVPVTTSSFNSTSLPLAPNMQVSIPDLPPVKTRPVNHSPQVVMDPKENEMMVNEKILISQQTSYPGGGPGQMFHYPNAPVQHVPTMYYMPDGSIQGRNVSVPNMSPMRAQFVQPYPVAQGQVPVGFPGMGQMYGGGVRQYEMSPQVFTNNAGQAMYYGTRNVGVVPDSYPGVVVQGGDEVPGAGAEQLSVRVPQLP